MELEREVELREISTKFKEYDPYMFRHPDGFEDFSRIVTLQHLSSISKNEEGKVGSILHCPSHGYKTRTGADSERIFPVSGDAKDHSSITRLKMISRRLVLDEQSCNFNIILAEVQVNLKLYLRSHRFGRVLFEI